MPDAERRALCHAAGKKICEHAEELARLLTEEQGKPLNGMGSRFELGGVQPGRTTPPTSPCPLRCCRTITRVGSSCIVSRLA